MGFAVVLLATALAANRFCDGTASIVSDSDGRGVRASSSCAS